MSKVVAKVKELWNQTATQFNTEEEMDNFLKNYKNISIDLVLDETDLITFSYTIKLPHGSIPDDDTMYEKNQGIKIILFAYFYLFICNKCSIRWFSTMQFSFYQKYLEVLVVINFNIGISSSPCSY